MKLKLLPGMILFKKLCVGTLFFLLTVCPFSKIFAQTQITGIIRSDQGQLLANVSVTVSGTSTGVVSDSNGSYSLSISEKAQSLTFSLVGYATQIVNIGGERVINVILLPDVHNLEDAVVVGYGSLNRKNVAASITTVKPADYKNQLITNSTDILKGRVAGVAITETSGSPGGDFKIRIRGANSILGGNDPLIVVDGVQGVIGLGDINPNDIQSMEILKDASATAIYGSRGANGVILITTKNGLDGPARVELNSYFSSSKTKNPYAMMDPVLYAETVNLGNGGSAYSQAQIDNLKNTGGSNMYDALLRRGQEQWIELSVRGGSKSIKYSFSGAYSNINGVVIGTKNRKYLIRSNISSDLNSKVTVGLNMFASQTAWHNVSSGYSQLTSALTWGPAEPVFNPDGSYNKFDPFGASYANPLMLIKEMNRDDNSSNGVISAFLKYKILPGLVFNSTLGLNVISGKSAYSNNELYALSPDIGGTTGAGQSAYSSKYWQLSNTLTYTKELGANHNFSVMAGFEPSKITGESFSANGRNLVTTSVGYNNLSLNEVKDISSNYSGSSLVSYFGRANYSFKDRYIVTASYRADGSSKFRGENQYSYFPSVGLAWKISQEPFLENAKWLSDLKLRGSWGKTGNQAISPYGTLSLLTPYDYSWGSTTIYPGYHPFGAANPDLKWEVTVQKDLGIDASFFNNRLSVVVDAYSKLTNGLLQAVALPLYNGGGTVFQNIGEIENRGLEFMLNATTIKSRNWKWDVGVNMTYAKNEVRSIGDESMIFPGGTYGGVSDKWFVVMPGQPLGTFFGYKWLGIWRASEAQEAAQYGLKPGDNKFEDINNDKVIDGLDNQVIGYSVPRFRAGFNSSVSYKNFTLSVLMEAVSNAKTYNYGYALASVLSSEGRTVTLADGADYWTPTNDDAKFANIFSSSYSALRNTSQFLQDASFFSMRNLSVSYTLAKTKSRFADIRLFISGQNLILITDYKGDNPEATATGQSDVDGGIDLGIYPRPKRYTAGLTLTF